MVLTCFPKYMRFPWSMNKNIVSSLFISTKYDVTMVQYVSKIYSITIIYCMAKNMVLSLFMSTNHGITMIYCMAKKFYVSKIFGNTIIYSQKHGIALVHVHKTWYYCCLCPQNMILPLFMSKKHGFIILNIKKCKSSMLFYVLIKMWNMRWSITYIGMHNTIFRSRTEPFSGKHPRGTWFSEELRHI